MSRLQNFINGAYVDVPEDRPTVPVTNPADGSVIGQVPESTREDVDEAVKIAAAAQAKWGTQTYKARVQCLFKLKALMEECQDEIVQIIRREHGKNVAEGKASLLKGIQKNKTRHKHEPPEVLEVSVGRRQELPWAVLPRP
ncbi:unnamed protein product [Prorocentrum cordatum]|uniref:Aldehyde dehydrogenase domain-containing protein n=1 Tax=Prorocentrum cordatum TaxID=2364126 RepID=A0ABN9S7C2_9DINO|nr:unnamed protein product [Polarella glacialis]